MSPGSARRYPSARTRTPPWRRKYELRGEHATGGVVLPLTNRRQYAAAAVSSRSETGFPAALMTGAMFRCRRSHSWLNRTAWTDLARNNRSCCRDNERIERGARIGRLGLCGVSLRCKRGQMCEEDLRRRSPSGSAYRRSLWACATTGRASRFAATVLGSSATR
jgi:hypothetical protein